MRKKSSLIVSVIAVVGFGSASTQEIYKWVDTEGLVHYGDRRPPATQYEEIRVEPAPSGTAAGEELLRLLERTETAAETRASAQQERAAIADIQAAERAVLDLRCLEARRDLVVLDWGWPVYQDAQGQVRLLWDRDAYTGEREFLDDSARAAERSRAKAEIMATCADPDDAEQQKLARSLFIQTEVCAAERALIQELERSTARTPESELARRREDLRKYCEQ